MGTIGDAGPCKEWFMCHPVGADIIRPHFYSINFVNPKAISAQAGKVRAQAPPI